MSNKRYGLAAALASAALFILGSAEATVLCPPSDLRTTAYAGPPPPAHVPSALRAKLQAAVATIITTNPLPAHALASDVHDLGMGSADDPRRSGAVKRACAIELRPWETDVRLAVQDVL